MAKINTIMQEHKSDVSKVEQGVLRNDKDLSAYLGGASCELLLLLRSLGLPYHKFGKTRFYFPNEIDEWIRTHGECNTVAIGCSTEHFQTKIINSKQSETTPQEKHININYGKRY